MPQRYLTNETIIERVKELEIPKRQMVVVGGAALKLQGINKKTADIDVVVPVARLLTLAVEMGQQGQRFRLDAAKVTDTLRVKLWGREDSCTLIEIGRMSIMPPPNDLLYQASFEELRDEATDIKGVLVSPPERILDWKRAVDREKDQADIQLIEAYLSN